MTDQSALPRVSELAAELSGPLLLPGSPAYEREIAPFNTALRHTPQLVVGAANVSDVQAAVRYATAHDLPVGVHATGHGYTSFKDGVLISTRRLDALTLDPARRTVTVGAGVRWRAVIDAAVPHGLAPVAGSAPDVGVVGYSLGGGLALMGRTFGFGTDRVRSLDLVTMDGRLRYVDAVSEPELFWALCGGSGNLGIVTEMTVELVEVSTVYGGGIFFAAEHAVAVLHAYTSWADALPERTNTSVAMAWLPPAPDVPEPLRGQTVVHLRVCHVGDAEEGERLLAPMREVAPALLDDVAEVPFSAVDSIHRDPVSPLPFYARGVMLREATGETIDALLAVVGPDTQIPMLIWDLRRQGGAFSRGPVAGNAVCGRDAAYNLQVVALSIPGTVEAMQAGVEAAMAAVEPWSTGRTVTNLHGMIGDETDRARAWDPATYRRLVALVRELDPAGLLRHGHTIGRQAEPVGGGH
jgi:FAD/FMN-containing dehydrogenase